MFYEEKLIDGVLMCRTSPRFGWAPAQGNVAAIANTLAAMTAHDRERVLRLFS